MYARNMLTMLTGAMLAGCGGDAPTGVGQRFSAASMTCGGGDVGPIMRPYGCQGIVLSVHDSTNLGLGPAIDAAAGTWNAAIDRINVGAVLIPVLANGSTASNVQVVVDFGGGPEWCGATSTYAGGGRITLTTRNQSLGRCNSNWSTDLGRVLMHEFGHLLGYTGGSHKFGAEAATGCAHYLPDDHTINGTVCQHEVEYLYAEYGYRAAPTDPNFWSIPIITGIDAHPNPLTVPYGGSAQILYGNFLFANQPTFQSSQPMNGAPLQWTSPDPRASVSANGLVTNHNSDVQSVDVPVKAMIGSIPSGDQLGLKMATIGTFVSAHLNGTPGPTPPGASFRISAITVAATPFTSATPQQLTAVVEDGGYPVSVMWWATYSDTSTYNFFQQTLNSSSLSLPVHAGSYNIQVRARPMNGKIPGIEYVQDFPVCTTSGGGGGGLAAPRNDGPTPDVVGGCTPP